MFRNGDGKLGVGGLEAAEEEDTALLAWSGLGIGFRWDL